MHTQENLAFSIHISEVRCLSGSGDYGVFSIALACAFISGLESWLLMHIYSDMPFTEVLPEDRVSINYLITSRQGAQKKDRKEE